MEGYVFYVISNALESTTSCMGEIKKEIVIKGGNDHATHIIRKCVAFVHTIVTLTDGLG